MGRRPLSEADTLVRDPPEADADAVPASVDDDETTIPVDVEEMELAAKSSVAVRDPTEPPRIIRREQPIAVGSGEHVAGGAYAELQVAGTGAVVTLPAHRVTATGAALEIPGDVELDVREGATVMLHLHLAPDADGNPIRARIPATIVFRRQARDDIPGGVSVRWDTSDPRAAQALDDVLARLGGG